MKRVLGLLRLAIMRGPFFLISYFRQSYLFDLRNGTNTHMRKGRDEYADILAADVHGVWYVCSRTDVIRDALSRARQFLGDSFGEYQFLDMGSGKGKSLLVYLQRYSGIARHPAVGIEYDPDLHRISLENLSVTGLSDRAVVVHGDAREARGCLSGRKVILYLYNPFDWSVMRPAIDGLAGLDLFVIYVDPVCRERLKSIGFSEIFHQAKGRPNQRLSLLHRSNK